MTISLLLALPIYFVHSQNTYETFGFPVDQFEVTQTFNRNIEDQMKRFSFVHFSVDDVNRTYANSYQRARCLLET